MPGFHFAEYSIPDDMTDGDALDFIRLTCKASGLRRHMANRAAAGRPAWHASDLLDAVKAERRALLARYA